MSERRFLAFNAAGGIAWATIVGLGTYCVGQSAAHAGGTPGLVMGATAALLMLGLMVGIKRGEKRAQHAADRELCPRTALAA